MRSKGKDKVGSETEENFEENRKRSVQNYVERYELAKKGWEETKARLRGGHKSVVDSVLYAVGDRERENRGGPVEEKDRGKEENNRRENEQDVIEEIEVLEGYEDIDFEDIEYIGDFEGIEDIVVSEEDVEGHGNAIDKGKQKSTGVKGNDLKDDADSGSSGEEDGRSEDDDSDDDTYMGLSLSADTEESVYEEFEVGELCVDNESELEDSELGTTSGDGPPTEATTLDEAESAARRPFFSVGMTYVDKKELKRAIDKYAITRGVNLKIVRSDKKTLKVIWEDGCPFTLYASTYGLNVGFQVKTLHYEHSCACVYKNPRASSMWLAEHFKEKVQESPQFKTSQMKNDVQKELMVNVSIHKCKRAKRKIMQEMEGSFKDEFGNLEAYCNELKVSNPGSDVSVEVSSEALEQGRRVFKRMYLCFNASKVGWKEGCRPLIGVDGTFLKGKSRGILLTAVGMDGNDSLYPLAFGLVEKENAVHWTWFLQCLCKSLDLGIGDTVTMMSDMQKGLLNAVSEVLPNAEHRLCARHIYANWSKKWRGNELKKLLFSCAWSTYEQQFKDNLTAMGLLKEDATKDAVSYNVKAWVRAYFTARCKSWVVDNNMSESFNAWIYECRFLPVIRMFDGIRLKMMAKWADSESNVHNWKGDFSPKCIELFESNRFLAVNCRVFFNGDEGYEVVDGQDRHSVCLPRGMCTCRAWDLTGIPCQHAICAMYHAKLDPKTQISHYYHKDTYLATYRTKLQPVRGKKFWDTHTFLPMQPPPIATLPGRPQKKRTRTEEPVRRRKKFVHGHNASVAGPSNQPEQPQLERLTRRGKSHKCSVCNKEGHNKSTCQEDRSGTRYGNRPKTPCQSAQQPSEAASSQEPSQQSSQQPPQVTQPTQEGLNQPQSYVVAPNPRKSSQTRATRLSSYKSRFEVGMGIRFEEATERVVYNPGLSSEVVINEGIGNEHHHADPQKTFPIPNEKKLRMSRGCKSSAPTGTRSIQFNPEPLNVAAPSDLPYQPPGLQWQGKPCVTTSQLLTQRQNRIHANKEKAKKPTI